MRLLNLTGEALALLPVALDAHCKRLMLDGAPVHERDLAVTVRRALLAETGVAEGQPGVLVIGQPGRAAMVAGVEEAAAILFGADVPTVLADALDGLRAALAVAAIATSARQVAVDGLLDAISRVTADGEVEPSVSLDEVRDAADVVEALTLADAEPVGEGIDRLMKRLNGVTGGPAGPRAIGAF